MQLIISSSSKRMSTSTQTSMRSATQHTLLHQSSRKCLKIQSSSSRHGSSSSATHFFSNGGSIWILAWRSTRTSSRFAECNYFRFISISPYIILRVEQHARMARVQGITGTRSVWPEGNVILSGFKSLDNIPKHKRCSKRVFQSLQGLSGLPRNFDCV